MRDIESSGFDCELQGDEELRTFDSVATPFDGKPLMEDAKPLIRDRD
jgi:hypothetical protein